jgi:23S rRNA (adenine2503-C2)-methyltransferase
LRDHFSVGGRRITVSTAGLPKAIAEWAEIGPPVKLAISLNSAIQRTRDEIMPGLARYPLTELGRACRRYWERTRRRPTFEYVLCGGVNDDGAHARALVDFSRRLPCKINVIPFNPWEGSRYRTPDEGRMAAFLAEVAKGPMALTVRRPRGAGISAACGTLANRAASRP